MNERLFAGDIAALMRSGEEFETSLPDVAHRLAHEFGLPWAAIRLHPIDTTENGRALALRAVAIERHEELRDAAVRQAA